MQYHHGNANGSGRKNIKYRVNNQPEVLAKVAAAVVAWRRLPCNIVVAVQNGVAEKIKTINWRCWQRWQRQWWPGGDCRATLLQQCKMQQALILAPFHWLLMWL